MWRGAVSETVQAILKVRKRMKVKIGTYRRSLDRARGRLVQPFVPR